MASQADTDRKRRFNQKRAGSDAKRWYRSKAWQVRRAHQLAEHPTCCLCDKEGVIRFKQRMVVDHHPPHRGDYQQFFTGPVRTLCKYHHDSQAQADEIRGYTLAVSHDGWPSDPSHPVNTGAPIPKNRNKRR